jgi:drug/metabolite transporter (DMT)-like permease
MNLMPPRARWTTTLALIGFALVTVAQVSNMILARGLAGSVPPFSLAFFRWAIVAASFAPQVISDVRRGVLPLRTNAASILATGFLGMFLCGAPVYIAANTTTAINIALIMALSPIVVLLLSYALSLERLGALQLFGMGFAFVGALIMVSRGDSRAFLDIQAAPGDLFMLIPMLGWSAYTLLQTRVAAKAGFLARVGVFAAAGAMFTLPFAAWEMWSTPQAAFSPRAWAAYGFAGLVPGAFAYAGFAHLAGKFGTGRASIALYLLPVAGALLSFVILGEPPGLMQVAGGSLILGGVWTSLRK